MQPSSPPPHQPNSSQTHRNVLLSCAVLLVAVCVGLSLLSAAGVGVGLWSARVARPTPAPTRIQITPLPTSTLDPAQTPVGLPEPPPAQIAAQMDRIQAQVIEIRGLRPSFAVPRGLLTHAGLQKKVVQDFFKEYTPEKAADDAVLLELVGLVPQGFDLIDFYTRLYTEQVAGFYDNEAKEMYVIQDESFTGVERDTYSHEYTHFLQDANFDFKNRMGDSTRACAGQSDRCAGVQALIEGDAVMTEQIWLARYVTPEDQQQIFRSAQTSSFPVYQSSPQYFQQDFLFPYRQGAEFVQSLYDQGGYNAVDQAFEHPPVSSEQILHPGKYPAETPLPVQIPDLAAALGKDWRQVKDDTLGEWATYLILTAGEDEQARLSAAEGRKGASGWGGDRVRVYLHDPDGARVLVALAAWDTERDAQEFQAAFERYARRRFGKPLDNSGALRWQSPQGLVQFSRTSTHTLWLIAPDAQTIEGIVENSYVP
ncbi:MAG TPA: hypothetical protein VMT46_06385 [Anaerolineaceae bacterium]|nr:hypothetical protein [Anaerolineaceae bacterium]